MDDLKFYAAFLLSLLFPDEDEKQVGRVEMWRRRWL